MPLALTLLLFGLGSAHASPLTSVNVDVVATATGSTNWHCNNGSGIIAVTSTCSAYSNTVYTPGLTAGQVGSVFVTVATGSSGANLSFQVCTGGTAGSGTCGGSSAFTVAGTGNTPTLTYTVPNSQYYIQIVTTTSTINLSGWSITAVQGTGSVGSVTYPTLDIAALSTQMGNFFGFIAPALYIVAGIALGGLIISKVRHLF